MDDINYSKKKVRVSICCPKFKIHCGSLVFFFSALIVDSIDVCYSIHGFLFGFSMRNQTTKAIIFLENRWYSTISSTDCIRRKELIPKARKTLFKLHSSNFSDRKLVTKIWIAKKEAACHFRILSDDTDKLTESVQNVDLLSCLGDNQGACVQRISSYFVIDLQQRGKCGGKHATSKIVITVLLVNFLPWPFDRFRRNWKCFM